MFFVNSDCKKKITADHRNIIKLSKLKKWRLLLHNLGSILFVVVYFLTFMSIRLSFPCI